MLNKKLPLILAIQAIVASMPIGASVLEEIVITAQKREQSAQDVGIAVTAYSGNQMKALGMTTASEVAAQAPGVQVSQPNGPATFSLSIRGVVQTEFTGHQEAPVALYLDEVYISQMQGAGFQLFDTDHAEILRGPQGTLYGRNATGGLAHYVSNKPSQFSEGYVELTLGNYDKVKVEGATGGSITDDVSGRLSFTQEKYDHMYENEDSNNGDAIDGNNWALRGQLLFEFDNSELLLSLRNAEQDIDQGGIKTIASTYNANGEVVLLPGQADAYGNINSSNENKTSGSIDGFHTLENRGGTATYSYDAESFSVTSITDYTTLESTYYEDSDGSAIQILNFGFTSDVKQFSQELRLSGDLDNNRWVAGLYYMDIDGAYTMETPYPGFEAAYVPYYGTAASYCSTCAFGSKSYWDMDTTTYSIFGQWEHDFNDTLTLIAGARYSVEEKDFAFVQDDAVYADPNNTDIHSILGNVFTFDDSTAEFKPSFDKVMWSGKLQLEWTPTEDTLIYTGVNRGIKAGGFNAPIDAIPLLSLTNAQANESMTFDEEVLTSYEIGFKTSILDNILRFNGAAFYYDYKDFQSLATVGLTQFVSNRDATNQGFELELTGSPMEGLDISFGFSYLDAEVETDSGDSRPPFASEISGNGLIRYEWPAFDGALSIQASTSYLGEYYAQLGEPEAFKDGELFVTNLRSTYVSDDDQWELALFVNNITDKRHLVAAYDLTAFTGSSQLFYNNPRTFGATATYRW
ncbi:TonB-dependent receptor [Dasania marina]|uniref:TonB-dependent receptor n=1 Tax=Dasania marina TaxID=471499 RepID=UPI0030DAFB08|tara:strand:- start:31669 stop:33906 length:2238 start_codon:yes stop_codon:yes gene_type:complete